MSTPRLTPLQNLLHNQKVVQRQNKRLFSMIVNSVCLLIVILLIATLVYRHTKNIKNKKKIKKYTQSNKNYV